MKRLGLKVLSLAFAVLTAPLLTAATTKSWNGSTYSIPEASDRNWSTLSDFLEDLADNAQSVTKQKVAVRVATSTPVTVSATTDFCVVTDLTVAGAVAVNLPAGVTGQMFAVVDGKADAATNNVTITPAAGLINGAATYVISKNRGGVVIAYNGTGWTVVSEFTAGSSSGGTVTVQDANFTLQDNGDATKQLQFQLSGITTATTRTLTVPDASDTLVGKATTDTLTNKTLTSPVLTTPLIDDAGTGDLTVTSASGLTAARTLTIDVNDAARTIDLTGNVVAGGTITTGAAFTTTPANALTLTTTGATNVTLPTTGTITNTLNTLDDFAATSSAELASVLSDETGTGLLVYGTSPTLTTPTIGVATATSVNKVAITAPAAAATLTIADGKTLTASNTLTFTGTDASSVAFGAGGTAAYTGNKLSVFAATSSAELASVLSDESGTGVAAYTTSPVITTPTVRTSLTLQNTSGAMPTLLLSEDPDNGTDAVTIQADDSFAGWTMTLPIDDGGANQVLQTNGSGVTSWATVAASITGSRGDLIRQGAASDEKFSAVTDNRVVRGDGTDVVSGQIDDPGFFTTAAAAGAAAIGIVTTDAQTLAGNKSLTGETTLGASGGGNYLHINSLFRVVSGSSVTVSSTGNWTSTELTTSVVDSSHVSFISATGGFSVHGIAARSDGTILFLVNNTNQTMALIHESGSEGTAANKIYFNGNPAANSTKSFTTASVAMLIYSGVQTRWLLVNFY